MQIFLGLVFGLPLLMAVGLYVLSAMTPRPENVGQANGVLAPAPESPNAVSSQADDESHAIAPLAFDQSAQDTMETLRKIVEGMPGATVISQSETYLYAEFRSQIFGFVDDVEFLVDPAENVIHVRSASRVGRSDLGVNRKRVEQIREAFGP